MKFIYACSSLLLSFQCCAELIQLPDEDLSEVLGQAFIGADHTSSNGIDYTKLSFGIDAKLSINADSLDIGNYQRGNQQGSDVRITDFALGEIDASGNLIPFEIRNPFVELAFEENNGNQGLVGFRLGFQGAKGGLSGNIESLTGNINIDLKDTAAGLANSDNGLAGLTAALLGSSPIEASGILVNSNGTANNIRAKEVGIVNGETFDIVPNNNTDKFFLSIASGLGIGGLNCVESAPFSCSRAQITANNCLAAGIDVCFNLTDFKSLDIGKKQTDGTFGLAEGLFLGFQTKDLTWNDGGVSTSAVPGVFFNVPNGGLEVTLEQAILGTARRRTQYVDPYF